MVHRHIGALLRKGDLNTCRAPRNECGQFSFSDPQETLVNVLSIDFALDNVENGDIAALLAWIGRDHAVLWLEKAAHHIQDCGFPYGLSLLDVVASKRGV